MSFHLEQKVRITRCDPKPSAIGMVTVISGGPFRSPNPMNPYAKCPVNGYWVRDAPGIVFFDQTLEPVDDDPLPGLEVEEDEEIEA